MKILSSTFSENVEDRIFNYNEALRPKEDRRGLRSDIQFNNQGISFRKRDSITKSYLKTFNDIYIIEIDSLDFDTDFIIGQSIKERIGFETFIDIKSLTDGKHLLKVNRKRVEKEGDTSIRVVARIPFWYYKD